MLYKTLRNPLLYLLFGVVQLSHPIQAADNLCQGAAKRIIYSIERVRV